MESYNAYPAQTHTLVSAQELQRVVASHPELAIAIGGDETARYRAARAREMVDMARLARSARQHPAMMWPHVPENKGPIAGEY